MRFSRRRPISIALDGAVSTDAAGALWDMPGVCRQMRQLCGLGPWAGEDVVHGLLERFVRRVVLTAPVALQRVGRGPLLFCANQQTALDSYTFNAVAVGLFGSPIQTLAASRIRDHWHARLFTHLWTHPGLALRPVTEWLDEGPQALLASLRILGNALRRGRSVLIHVEGHRAVTCRQPITRLSSTVIDLAVATRTPIVPVRFTGGLPEAAGRKLEFPLGFGTQDHYLGRPIPPEEMEALPYAGRRQALLRALNALGPGNEKERPHPGDAEFGAAVAEWVARTGASEECAAVFRTLEGLTAPSPETRLLLDGAHSGRLRLGNGPEGTWLSELTRAVSGAPGPTIVGDPSPV